MSLDDSALTPPKDQDGGSAADPANADDPTLRRRMFLRKLTADAVLAGGRLTGSASIMRRSAAAAAAAGETLLRELDTRPPASPEGVTARDQPIRPEAGASTALTDVSPPQAVEAGPSEAPWSQPLTPPQAALLASAIPAAIATVQPGNAPQLTASPFHWDGSVFRISALDWTARTQNIEIDARVSLLIADPRGGLAVSVSGRAVVIGGPSARDETLPILRKYAVEEAEVTARWAALNADGDRVVIVVLPERMLWRVDEAAWRSTRSPDAPPS
jgi:hypothetical protein